MLDDIRTLVETESPSSDDAALMRSADAVAALGTKLLGAPPERDGIHLIWRFGGPTRVLVLCHHDTVWPLGSLTTHPCTVTDGVLRGPGCFDMKTGLVMAFHAIASLTDRTGVTLLVTGDEELGSPGSRALIEAEAAGAKAALVLEASGPGGALKTERKGSSGYSLRVHGKAAHSGLEPERGHNAGIELAHQILAIATLGDTSLGTTVTPTLMSAGTSRNTVPALAEVAIDVRATTPGELSRVDLALRALRPVDPAIRLELSNLSHRPPMTADSSAALFAKAAKLAADLGLPPLTKLAVGGGSDGNLTAGMGVPTLDGLGAVGGGAHADDEHVVVAEIPGRTALLAALIAAVIAEGE
ncbi:MAG: M20/M25/M40 family metallo-hydrolase [Hamadaea sp.]|nr:M20/M25/M40 family metallo-hydrolase [Hamadaea sp.]NUR48859.1 M20/M25/M40 family metallo-hydrolase [Hamadaea sp.]NUT07081.1 M20/M25/M40 family metallo-hydrolase [Hamadaea sp.]